MQKVCDWTALQASANRNPFVSLKTKYLNVAKSGFVKPAGITRLALPILVLAGLGQRAHATLDTTTHTSAHPLLAVTDTELSGTARDLTLSVTNLPPDPVKKVTYYLDFETDMDPNTISVDVETGILDQVSCSSSWSVSDARLTVSLTFATPYDLSEGAVMVVHIVDYSTPSMISNELVALGGIVISDNLDGIRMGHPNAVADTAPAPGNAELSSRPQLYPSVTSGELTISGLAGNNGQLLVMQAQGQIVKTVPLTGTAQVHLDLHALPMGMYYIVLPGVQGQSRLTLFKQ